MLIIERMGLPAFSKRDDASTASTVRQNPSLTEMALTGRASELSADLRKTGGI